MLILIGSDPYSAFRREQLGMAELPAFYYYFCETHAELTLDELQHLQALLQARTELPTPTNLQLVTPRVGTISPWSSKATDILQHCGLNKITRVERGIGYHVETGKTLAANLWDPMTETVLENLDAAHTLFQQTQAEPLSHIPVLQQGRDALVSADKNLGLALSDAEIDYLHQAYVDLKRDPTDVEIMMFAQANSEHCRHKIFNATWKIDDVEQAHSLFAMIRNTHKQNPHGVLSAYSDNAAVIQSTEGDRWFCDPNSGKYTYQHEAIPIVLKVETHNHPTAIAPFPGAATGAGGEIRDEAATGRGAKAKAGLVGFSVSNLRIPTLSQAWETHAGKPDNIASALDIMIQGPIGAASFNNEFGRPNICGYFRTYEQQVEDVTGSAWRGYHKPIMLAGGLGNIRSEHVDKNDFPVDTAIIVLGGPAMQIGLGGGAASSITTGANKAELDFASVQRDNPEMQRRCQEVIDACWALGANNPIASIHDVGAGGLANALPELLDASERGGLLDLRLIPNAEPGMSPLAVWCNESQERYVLAIDHTQLALFEKIAQRERCPFAVLGRATAERDLVVTDPLFDNQPVDLPLQILLGETPKMQRETKTETVEHAAWQRDDIDLKDAAERLLQLPTVGDKSFLITIGDRSVGGMVARDQMVGPWQVPVADCGVTLQSFKGYHGEALAIGERTPVALLDAAASARMAVAEAITNIAAAPIAELSDIKLSANWMSPAGYPGEDAGLYAAVKAIGMELCPALGIAIPVGKDSMSMRMQWQDSDGDHSVTSPLSLIITAAGPVTDVRRALTPELQTDQGGTELIFIDLAQGSQRLGASCVAQVFNQLDQQPADLINAATLKNFFSAIQALNTANLLLAYHDRSDGGLFVTLCEMAFAAHCGIDVYVDDLGDDVFAALFNEELGAVIQIRHDDHEAVFELLKQHDLESAALAIGTVNSRDEITFWQQQQSVLQASRSDWHGLWSKTSYHMQALRDNPDCAKQAYDAITNNTDLGLQPHLTFDINQDITAPFVNTSRPKVAILREQGVNGQLEMAAAFDRAGFECIDIHMTDIIDRQRNLSEFIGLAVCGGFSYGDVLGAGRGWANTILHHPQVLHAFTDFFARSDTFTLGVCNGCQMLSNLSAIIPGSACWPKFLRNHSEQFEARLSLVEVLESPSVLLQGMVGSRLPIIVSHGEGRAHWDDTSAAQSVLQQQLASLRYVDGAGQVATTYPTNPNGSPEGITGLCSIDGRVTLMMPHPERIFRTAQHSWAPREWGEDGPWIRLFRNARAFVK